MGTSAAKPPPVQNFQVVKEPLPQQAHSYCTTTVREFQQRLLATLGIDKLLIRRFPSVDLFFFLLQAPVNHDHEADYRYVGQGNEVIMWGKSWIHPIGQPMERPIPIAHRFVFERGKLVLLEDVYDTLAGSESLHG